MTDLESIANDVLNEMYDEAEPGLDFDHLRENPDEYPDDWYQQHTLSAERQREILDKHVDEHDLTERESASLSWECILNKGPSSGGV